VQVAVEAVADAEADQPVEIGLGEVDRTVVESREEVGLIVEERREVALLAEGSPRGTNHAVLVLESVADLLVSAKLEEADLIAVVSTIRRVDLVAGVMLEKVGHAVTVKQNEAGPSVEIKIRKAVLSVEVMTREVLLKIAEMLREVHLVEIILKVKGADLEVMPALSVEIKAVKMLRGVGLAVMTLPNVIVLAVGMPKIVVQKVLQRRGIVQKAKKILEKVDQEVVVKQKRSGLKVTSQRNVLRVVMLSEGIAGHLAGIKRKKVGQEAAIKEVREADLEVVTSRIEVQVTVQKLERALRRGEALVDQQAHMKTKKVLCSKTWIRILPEAKVMLVVILTTTIRHPDKMNTVVLVVLVMTVVA